MNSFQDVTFHNNQYVCGGVGFQETDLRCNSFFLIKIDCQLAEVIFIN